MTPMKKTRFWILQWNVQQFENSLELLFLGEWLGTHSKVSRETMLQLKHKIWVATNLCICLKKLNSVSGCCNCSMVVKIKSFVLIAHSRINKKGAYYVVELLFYTFCTSNQEHRLPEQRVKRVKILHPDNIAKFSLL